MSALIVMVIVSLALALSFLAAFLWAYLSGQFRDSATPGMRILHEQTPVRTGKKHTQDKEHHNE